MKRRSFLRKLALVPVMAAVATDLVFGSPEVKEVVEISPLYERLDPMDFPLNTIIKAIEKRREENRNIYTGVEWNV